MWFELSNDDKGVYKRLILAFASLSEAFAQKEDQSASQGKSKVIRPIVNSKFQESCFQYAFNASAEDIGNYISKLFKFSRSALIDFFQERTYNFSIFFQHINIKRQL